jgi:hypothetical protein
MENNWNEPQRDLPNATFILVLGIISIAGCCCTYGTVGLICGIIALVLAKTATNLYEADPQKYRESSYKNVNAGKICAWIGIIPSILYILFILFLIYAIGFAALSDPNLIYDYFGVQSPY